MAACSRATPSASPTTAPPDTGLPQQASPTAPVKNTEVLPPTVTPTALASRVILVIPPGADATQAGLVQSALASLAEQSGYVLQVLPALTPADLTADVRVVVVLPPDPGVANLVAAAPAVQFLAIGIPGLQAAGNLSLLAAQGERPDQQGFLAGYLAAVITNDWRVGVISSQDTPAGKSSRQGFLNGVIYYCGLCRPSFPPFQQYPLYADVPSSTGQIDWRAAADNLISRAVQTVFVAPTANDPDLLDYLVQAGVNIIGVSAPTNKAQARWVASVQSDLAKGIQDLWPVLLKGQSGGEQATPLVITNVNPQLLSPGRQVWIQETLADLVAGRIDTGVDPQTGDPR